MAVHQGVSMFTSGVQTENNEPNDKEPVQGREDRDVIESFRVPILTSTLQSAG